MKKTRIALIAVVLILALLAPMSVLAASPVSGPVAVVGVAEGVRLEAKAGAVSEAQKTNFAAKAKEYNIPGDVTYYDLTLYDVNGDVYQPGTNVTVRIDMAAVRANDRVTVLHANADGTITAIGTTCYNGYFTFVTKSFSPFAIYRQVGGGTTGGGGGGGTTAASPATGVYA